MENNNIDLLLKLQKEFFGSGKTLSVKFRIEMLKVLYNSVKAHETQIKDALYKDLGKSEFESYMCETGLLLSEITYMIKHTKKFAKKKRVSTPLSQFPSKSYIQPSPLGNVLIISPWNYPILLTLEPLANAIAAGNTAILKPSAYAPNSSKILSEIIKECFPPEYVALIEGGRKENSLLLSKKFDLVFFTGSKSVGKEVLRHTAEHLTPAVLELGGKSPCIVDESAKIPLSAKRIIFGKFLNCGQTCVAPDYILCHSSVKKQLVEELKKQIVLQFGSSPLENESYGKIINEKHFNRLTELLQNSTVLYGGNWDENKLKITPTIVEATKDSKIMEDEIFGPILPILTYETINDVISYINSKPKPLSLYIFSESKENINNITERISYGGGCINDVIIHLATSEMGFGGVGESGMGQYHGKAGFDAFSHKKSIVNKRMWLDLPMRYQPYKKGLMEKLVRMFLK